MAPETIADLIRELESQPAWGFTAGPAGIHVDFGTPSPAPSGGQVGRISVWIKTRVRAVKRGEVLLDTPIPNSEDAKMLTGLVGARFVSRAGFDPKNNSLRLLFETEVLLSVFPGTRSSGRSWNLYDNRSRPEGDFVVFADSIHLTLAK